MSKDFSDVPQHSPSACSVAGVRSQLTSASSVRDGGKAAEASAVLLLLLLLLLLPLWQEAADATACGCAVPC